MSSGSHASAAVARATSVPVSVWRTIPSMRGIAMCLVVANHAIQASAAISLTDRTVLSPRTDPLVFTSLWLLRGLTPVCLLMFMFASGFTAFRFFTDAKVAWSGAFQLLRKYLAWSIGLYALDALLGHHVSWRYVLSGLVRGDAKPAYWFLVALLVLYVTAPAWIKLTKTRPMLAVSLALTVQLGSCLAFYLYEQAPRALSTWEVLFIRPYRFLPAFMLGMVASRHATALATWLHGRRRAWLMLTVSAGVVNLVESFMVGARSDFRVDAMHAMFAAERGSLIVFAFASIGLIMGTDFGRSRASQWLGEVGNASLGVMLLMDLSILTVVRCVWQLPRFVWPAAATAYAHHTLPSGLIGSAVVLTPFLFAAGLWGPLTIMNVARRSLGPRARQLW